MIKKNGMLKTFLHCVLIDVHAYIVKHLRFIKKNILNIYKSAYKITIFIIILIYLFHFSHIFIYPPPKSPSPLNRPMQKTVLWVSIQL